MQEYIDSKPYTDYFYKVSPRSLPMKVPKLKDVRGKIVLLNFYNDGHCNGQQGLCAPWAWKNDETVANNYEPQCWGTNGLHCKKYIESQEEQKK